MKTILTLAAALTASAAAAQLVPATPQTAATVTASPDMPRPANDAAATNPTITPQASGTTAATTTAAAPGTDARGGEMAAATMGAGKVAMSGDDARARLEGEGYTNVKGLQRRADGSWMARAKKDGKNTRVAVTADGAIQPE